MKGIIDADGARARARAAYLAQSPERRPLKAVMDPASAMEAWSELHSFIVW